MRQRQPDNANDNSNALQDESQKLQKVIAASGRGSRRQVEELIAAGRVTVDGEVAHLGQRVTAAQEIIVDGAVDAPDTLGKLLGPELFEKLRDAKGKEKDGLLLPIEMAETYYHIAHQHRSAWTHELDMRAHSDLAWWNHAP